jgi:NitT/TauT family transport system permease protein
LTPSVRRPLRGVAGIVIVLGACELAEWAARVDFPLPSAVLARAAGLITNGSFLAATGQTMVSWAEAMAITVVIAIPAGLLLGSAPWLESAVRPVIEFLRPIPSVTLVPLVLLVVQDNHKTEVVVIVLAALWPVLINTIYGLREVDPLAKETLRSFGFGPLALALRVSLPSAAPFIATGVRIAASVTFVIAIAVELVGTGMNGLGTFVGNSQAGGGDITLMLAVVAWSGLVGIALNIIFTAAERRFFGWHYALASSLTAGGPA